MDPDIAIIRYQWVNAGFGTLRKCILIKHDTYLFVNKRKNGVN